MDFNCDRIIFQNETAYIDNLIHLLHCAPKCDSDEQVIKLMLDKTIKFLIQMFDIFHEHTKALKHHMMQHKQHDKNDYSDLKEICTIMQRLINDFHEKIKIAQRDVMVNYQKGYDVLSCKPKGLICHLQETKIKSNIKILLFLLNCTSQKLEIVDFSGMHEDPQIYIEEQLRLLEDQNDKALEDLKAEIKSIRTKKISINQTSKSFHYTLVNQWVIKEKLFDKEKSKVDQQLTQKLHLHKHSLEMNLKEKVTIWEQNIEKCKVHHENEISKLKNEFQQLKNLHEQQYSKACKEFEKTLEFRKNQNLEEYNCKIELCNLKFQQEKQALKSKRKYSNQHINKASALENALITKKQCVDEAKVKKRTADEQVEKEFEAQCKLALREKENKVLKNHNCLTSLLINSEENMSKAILKINEERKERESKVWIMFNQKCKDTKRLSQTVLSNIERRKSTEYIKVNDGIDSVEETMTSKINDSTREGYEIIAKFEEELENNEIIMIAETKRLLLQNLLHAAQVQYACLSHIKLQQIQLTKAVSISHNYTTFALKNIESYLYTVDFFWEEIISQCSSLMRDVVPENLLNQNKKVETKKSEIDQKSTTFKIKAQEFYVKCSAFIDECSVIDKKIIIAREGILKFYNLATQIEHI